MNLKKCGHNLGCGCKDSALTTNLPCPPGTPCINPEPCAQVWDMHCIIYTGNTIVDLDINPGDRMDEIMQKLILNGLNPGCVDPTSTCQSALNLAAQVIGTTSITVDCPDGRTAVT